MSLSYTQIEKALERTVSRGALVEHKKAASGHYLDEGGSTLKGVKALEAASGLIGGEVTWQSAAIHDRTWHRCWNRNGDADDRIDDLCW